LRVKHDKMPSKRSLLKRDIALLEHFYFNLVMKYPAIEEKRIALHAANTGAWDANEILISMRDCNDETKGHIGFRAWLVADGFNQNRVRLKNEINELCCSYVREEKSYDTRT
jgi:hypothetical protein